MSITQANFIINVHLRVSFLEFLGLSCIDKRTCINQVEDTVKFIGTFTLRDFT